MPPQRAQDPLETLQLMVTDVLVQTGKALRASRKDGIGNTPQAHGSLQSKLPETIRTFHSALDDLENDIIRAKSVLLRDISELQARRNPPVVAPQPIESQSKSPMVIDIDSSSPVDTGHQQLLQGDALKQMAPFPDMGLDPSEAAAPSSSTVPIKEEATHPDLSLMEPDDAPDIKVESTAAPQAAMAPMPLMDEPNIDESSNDLPPEIPTDQPDSGLNFTDMAFTLATNNDGQEQQPTKDEEPNFDLTTFAPPEGTEAMSLGNILPPKPTMETPVPPADAQDTSANTQDDIGAKKEEVGDDLDNYDFGTGTGTGFGDGNGNDFDFSLGGGDDTFNDLMDNRDQTFDLGDMDMEHGDFDAAYFGIENDET